MMEWWCTGSRGLEGGAGIRCGGPAAWDSSQASGEAEDGKDGAVHVLATKGSWQERPSSLLIWDRREQSDRRRCAVLSVVICTKLRSDAGAVRVDVEQI